MGVIKGVLKEELKSSINMRKQYQGELKKCPAGSFVRKEIKGNVYFYHAYRDGKKVRFVYKGKAISGKDKQELEKRKKLRENYKNNIKKLDRRIKYLRKILNGKEDV